MVLDDARRPNIAAALRAARGYRTRQGRRRRSASSARAAARPLMPCTAPPGWVEAPATGRAPSIEVLERADDRVWLACGERTRLGLWTPGKKEYGDQGGRHVHFAFSVAPGQLSVVAERLADLRVSHRGPVEHDGGDRSLYFEDPEGNLVELWDYFEHGDGARDGVSALAEG